MKNNSEKEVNKKVSFISFKKILMFLLHIFSLGVLVTGVVNIMRSPNFTKGIFWMNAKKYEDSEVFVSEFEENTAMLFDYIFLKNIFETDGVLDEGKSLFVIEKNQGMSEEYTVGDVVSIANEELGLYFDDRENFQVLQSESVKTDLFSVERDLNKKYLVSWKSYGDVFFEEESQMNMSVSELVFESMEYLGRYYNAKRRTDINRSNLRYRMTFGEKIDTNDESFVYDKLKDYGKYAAVNSEYLTVETNLPNIPDNLKYLADTTSNIMESSYQVLIAIDTDYPKEDYFSMESKKYVKDRENYFRGILLLMVGLFGMLTTFGLMVFYSGRTSKGGQTTKIIGMDKFGVEVNVMVAFLASLSIQYLYRSSFDKIFGIILFDVSLIQSRAIITGVLGYLCASAVVFSVVRSVKAGVLYEYSFLKKLVDGFGIFKNGEDYTKGVLRNFIVFCVVNLGFTFFAAYLYCTRVGLIEKIISVILILFILMLDVMLYNRVYQNMIQREQIAGVVHQMSEGDTGFYLDVKDFCGREAEMASDLNNIGQGLKKAISEQVKSEKMKADLITNVSHDLKTPLTKIVSYIGLIRKENPTQPKILEHIQTIENSAQRLNSLTDDLLEASRAASGTIKLEIGDIDFVSLVKQANGEFEEKYRERKLEIVSDLPKESLIIRADGSKLWRVIENLYNNAYKYALMESRVYVNMVKKEEKAIFTIKNISQAALNIKPEELAERFVRGDVSRSTVGHGLGLSIARSLTELQKGMFEISIDGDLFKITLSFLLSENVRWRQKSSDEV